MALRFLTGVALVAGAATYLARRYRNQLESASGALLADRSSKPGSWPPAERPVATSTHGLQPDPGAAPTA